MLKSRLDGLEKRRFPIDGSGGQNKQKVEKSDEYPSFVSNKIKLGAEPYGLLDAIHYIVMYTVYPLSRSCWFLLSFWKRDPASLR